MGQDEYIPVSYQPIGGVNQADPEDSLNPNEVSDARNFLFEQKIAQTRPGCDILTLTGLAGKTITYARGAQSYLTNFLLDYLHNQIYLLDVDTFSGYVLSGPLAGPAVIFDLLSLGGEGSVGNGSVAEVNGSVIIANNTTGMIHYDGGAYTLLTPTFRYVKSHLSRAVAAFDITAGAGNEITFAWSAAGDETAWGGSTDGSGLVILSDATDFITGLEIIQNAVVIFRQTGIHIANPTGVAYPSAYNIETWNRGKVGCFYPSSLDSDNNIAYFIGSDDVYTFDLQELKPIGYKIKQTLLDLICSTNANPIGFVTRSLNSSDTSLGKLVPALRYHIIVGSTHFVYTIGEDKWSIHDVSNPDGEALYTPAYFNLFGFLGTNLAVGSSHHPKCHIGYAELDSNPTNPLLYLWDNAIEVDHDAYFEGPTFQAPSREKDSLLQRVLVSNRDYGCVPVTISVQSRQGKELSTQDTESSSTGQNNDEYLVRSYFNFMDQDSANGQTFTPRFTVRAGHRFACNYYSLLFSDGGDYRG